MGLWIVGIILSAIFIRWYFFPYYVPYIPIKKANSIMGYSNTLGTSKGKMDSHLINLQEAESTGKIFQYYYLGRLVVMISDKYIAKYALL